MPEHQPKPFWQKPEGIAGVLFLLLLLAGGGYLVSMLPPLAVILENVFLMLGLALGLTVVLFAALEPNMRAMASFGYKSLVRWLTGLFIEMDPIAALKGYVDDLHDKLRNMDKQINQLRGQRHQLMEMIFNNKKEIEQNLKAAGEAKEAQDEPVLILKSRKAGRLQDSNARLETLYQKMDLLFQVLTRMYTNSEVLAEDIRDQVRVKEQERTAIHTSTSAMRSAMSMLKGDKDKRALFDQALEATADDIAQKVGEMERFMQVSANFMDSIDLQNGIFQDQGLEMLEKWQRESMANLLGAETKDDILQQVKAGNQPALDLNKPIEQPIKAERGNQYDNFF